MESTTKAAEVVPTQATFVETAELQLKEWSARVDQLSTDAEKLTADAKSTAQKKVGELKAKLGAAREKLNANKAVASEKWAEAKIGVEKLWIEVKDLFDKHDPKKVS